MTNLVAVYSFDNPATEEKISQKIKERFNRKKEERYNGLPYFAFSARNQPEASDGIKSILNGMTIGDADFVALFFSPEEKPDQIKRVMVLGRDSYLENKFDKSTLNFHNNLLTDLL